ncbi:MAG: BolA family transcriptional regulator [Gammaproteobacteria bacterium]|nr:BolA family transcriptional regulator [Gammaproteobacteria bacterium]MBU1647530.1 BolA family transcriptional regulator [Gammaproteobacteria bacterium]MBU1972979.1 BolA family transcriptional regulator [Gammaproteobacteria bacterium]
MNTAETLRERLAKLDPQQIDIIDDSHRHAGHAGARDGGGHFRLHIVAAAFAGKRTMERHRLVYDAAGDLMKQKIHALSITAKAPDET